MSDEVENEAGSSEAAESTPEPAPAPTPEPHTESAEEIGAAMGEALTDAVAGHPGEELPADSEGLLYGLDDIPPPMETVALGFQHYLTMFGSTVAIPLILAPAFGIDPTTTEGGVDLAKLMATMFFISGITTILQTTWGNRLPIVQGGTFSFLGPTFAICGMAAVAGEGWEVKMQHVQGAIIMGSVVEIAMGVTGLAGWVLRFVGPITIAPTIALIGLALFKFGAPVAGQHWPMGGLTIALIILFSQVLRTKHRAFELYPILLALLLAWGVAVVMTMLGVFHGQEVDAVTGEVIKAAHPSHVSTANIANAPWVRIPTPFQWGWPQFTLAGFVGMFAGYLASMVESIGDYFACARLAGAPPPDAKLVNKGITFEGIGCLIAGVFGTGNGTTSYSENIGAIGLTRVGSRRVVQAGALIMLLLGTVGKFGALFTTIPQPIVGGMYCALFGMIAAVGLSNLPLVTLNSSRNLFILGFAFFMGLSVPEYFNANPVVLLELAEGVDPTAGQQALAILQDVINTIGKTGMAIAALLALILDNIVPGTREERCLVHMSAH
jgi:nucleobase transporter 1/2